MAVATMSETEAAQAAVIHAAERAGVDPRAIQRALKISRRTYYRRRRLSDEIKARAESEAEGD